MVRPDIIVTWPKHIDYPPFRLFIKMYWPFFEETFIVFTDHHIDGWDFTSDVARSVDSATIMFAKGEKKDWRDDAVNLALDSSKNDWVLFIEQDFFIKSQEDLGYILKQEYDFVALKQEGRWHPAFMLVKRECIDKTSRNFAADPKGKYDHFGKFTKELEKNKCSMVSLDDLGVRENKDYRHMNGLSYNITQCILGKEHLYRPDEFKWYLKHSSENIHVSQQYIALEKICKYAVRKGSKKRKKKKS